MSRILVIDDSPLIVQLLEEFLLSHGFELAIAMDASDGYEKAISWEPDLILLDVKLPDVTGFDLLRMMRTRDDLKTVPVIMLTATAQSPAEKVQGFQQGADDYVLKPFDNGELLERIRIQLRKHEEIHAQQAAPTSTPSSPSPLEEKALEPISAQSLHALVLDIVLSPSQVHPGSIRPGMPAVILLGSLVLTQAALALTAGPTVGALMAAVGVGALWLGVVVIVVMASSILGIAIRFKDAASIVSCAGVPILLKLFGALVFSAWTTLSPFHFTASPALLGEAVPLWMVRLDLFEIWSYVLLAFFISQWPKSSIQKARVLTIILALTLLGASLLFPKRSHAAMDGMPVGSLTLGDFEQMAIDKGVQGRLTELALENAGYSRTIAFRQTDSPNLTVTHDVTREETDVNGVKTRGDDRTSTLELQQPTVLGTDIRAKGLYGNANQPGLTASVVQPIYLFTWNASLRTRKRADLNFANARDTFDATVLALRAQARSLYYDVMLGEESIKVEERKVNSSKKLLDITQALVDAGKTAPVETMRAKIRAQTDERQLQNAVTTRDIALLNAKNFVFWPIEDPVHFTTQLEFKPFDIPLDRLVDYALIHRPELRSVRRSQELATLATQEAIEPGRPGIALTSTYDYNDISNTLTKSWSFGGQARWLFFDSFVTRDRVRIARINEWVANLNVTDSERTTRVDVQNAYLNVKRAEKQIQAFQFSREQAKRNVEVLRLRFQNGLERLIDVFDAENEMRNLDNEYLNLVVSYNRAIDSLSRLLGADAKGLR